MVADAAARVGRGDGPVHGGSPGAGDPARAEVFEAALAVADGAAHVACRAAVALHAEAVDACLCRKGGARGQDAGKGE